MYDAIMTAADASDAVGSQGKIFQIPPDFVVDRWAPDGESGSHRPFLFRYDVWTMFHGQIREKITSALSMA
jgi:hypothetical protein